MRSRLTKEEVAHGRERGYPLSIPAMHCIALPGVVELYRDQLVTDASLNTVQKITIRINYILSYYTLAKLVLFLHLLPSFSHTVSALIMAIRL